MDAEEVLKSIDPAYANMWWFSIDVDSKNERIVLGTYVEDPDFPELWVYFTNGDEPKRLDRKNPGIEVPCPEGFNEKFWHGYYDLINQPLGALMWADDGKDVIWKDGDNDYFWRFKIDDSVWAINGVINEYQLSPAEQERLAKVKYR